MTGGQFRQKQSLYKTSFDFGEDELTYSFDNSRTKVGGTTPYYKIPKRTSYREVKMWWLQYAVVFIGTFSAVSVTHYVFMNDTATVMYILYAAVLALLCACLLALMQRHRGMTGIALDPVLYILHDGQQDHILQEIMTRRVEMMKKKLAVVDFNKPYFEEIRKFRLLREEGIISEQEYRGARQKIAAMRDKPGTMPPQPGKAN